VRCEVVSQMQLRSGVVTFTALKKAQPCSICPSHRFLESRFAAILQPQPFVSHREGCSCGLQVLKVLALHACASQPARPCTFLLAALAPTPYPLLRCHQPEHTNNAHFQREHLKYALIYESAVSVSVFHAS